MSTNKYFLKTIRILNMHLVSNTITQNILEQDKFKYLEKILIYKTTNYLNISHLTFLRSLTLFSVDVEGISRLTNLRKLNFIGASKHFIQSDIEKLSMITNLSLTNTNIIDISHLTNLKVLKLSGFHCYVKKYNIYKLTTLTSLVFFNNNNTITNIEYLTNLTFLCANNKFILDNESIIKKMTMLTNICNQKYCYH